MLLNLPREGARNSGSEMPGSSEDGQLVLALTKMMKKEVELMVINAVKEVIVPMFGSLIRNVVKEEIQSAVMNLVNGNHAHEPTISTESRSLQLKFLDEVSLPVLTGKEIEGIGGTMRLAVVDSETEHIVNSGPEASAKVEILLLKADDDDNNGHNWSTEDFNNKIIMESDKEKPHVAKGTYVCLKEGVCILSDVKLGHGSSWKKRCLCRLGARVVGNSNGSRVKEAWTESFMVEDRRGKLYAKHYPPALSDDIWRLEKIGKDGERCKRLYKENILTVQDFLFALSADPQKLKSLFRGPTEWKAAVVHARTCNIDDKKIYLYTSPQFNFYVAFDAVARLMGIVRDSHYVQLDNLSEVERASAGELLLLAFKNRKDITSIDDETSLVREFPCESHDIGADTDSVPNDEYAPIEPDTSSPTISPSMCPSNNFSLAGSERMPQICDPSLPVPDQAPSSSATALSSNQGLYDPSFIVPSQGPSSLPIALGSSHTLCDPSLAVPYQGRSSSLISLGSNQALCDTSLILCDQGPIYSPIDMGLYQALGCPSFTLPDQSPINPLNDLGSDQALFYPSFTVSDQVPIFSLVTGSYQAPCNPFSTVCDQGPSLSPFALGSKHAFCGSSLSLPDQGSSSSTIPLGSCQALLDPSLTVPEQTSTGRLTDRNSLLERFDGNELTSLFYHHNKNNFKTWAKSRSVGQSNAGSIRFFAAVCVAMWQSRARKKRVMDFCDLGAEKRPRTG
ncbi:hypothetical protein F511_22710 [Dorcoceras hygrometricum]|uniref:Calmodulin-binding protein 60 A-like n=1 Tax=Dorcoceras hygrometricum TaxID=472368 RepID=A0A2Z7C611_9LAMI|nr:hypothetical protein F511_22710 [Dorcoceras hygrometricum]